MGERIIEVTVRVKPGTPEGVLQQVQMLSWPEGEPDGITAARCGKVAQKCAAAVLDALSAKEAPRG